MYDPTINCIMAKTPSNPDRHKNYKWARIRKVLADLIDQSCEAQAMDFTEWINSAAREKLEREGRFPIPNKKQK